ncbi:MAG: hypothetical protein Q9Q40_06290 [Acidobacteriota bacterium]|nr:hypothetical protein [Acidobacteriota bacterium]
MIARRSFLLVLVVLLALAGVGAASGGDDADEWVEVDYSSLVDRRRLTHSGQAVGEWLDRLAAEPGNSGTRELALPLLDPLLEPMAFVLPDALDTLQGVPGRELVELGWLWEPGEAAPAWVELLRARKWLLESDGEGFVRVFLPAPENGIPSALAARRAFERAWPGLRHPLAAEWRRLQAAGKRPPQLKVEVYPYRHDLAHSRFFLGTVPHGRTLDTQTPAPAAEVDLGIFEPFLGAGGWQIEGARLREGELVLTGSRPPEPKPIPGGPLTLADVAVAYRAVFHGSLAPPYMSLDRSAWPHRLVVNFGGRLADTRLGWISLLCDARFKTFSTGFGPRSWLDRRAAIHQHVPGFLTHVERFARDPRSVGSSGQQTRLWFYPDEVDLTLSSQGDLLALRRVRMAAAAEKVGSLDDAGRPRSVAPWTRALTREINASYDRLARVFPELEGLDQLSRLLSLFTWLRHLRDAGQATGDLDLLLAVPLPAFPTPRTFPQMVVVPAIPASGPGAIDLFPRLPVVRAMDNLLPRAGERLPAALRLRRIQGVLDRRHRGEARMLEALGRQGAGANGEEALDRLVFEAERVRLHRLSLATVGETARQRLLARDQAGEKLRVFSLSIGGLDLDFSRALATARSVSMGLGRAVARPTPSPAVARGPAGRPPPAEKAEQRSWLDLPDALEAPVMPAHGAGVPGSSRFRSRRQAAVEARRGLSEVDLLPSSPWRHLRRLELEAGGRLGAILRIESGRSLHYRLARLRGKLSARQLPWPAGPRWGPALSAPGPGVVVGRLQPAPRPGGLRLEIPRPGEEPGWVELGPASARRLLLGPEVDLAPPGTGVPSLVPPGGPLAGLRSLLLELPPRLLDPLGPGAAPLPPVLDPLRVAPALSRWWAGTGSSVAVLVRGKNGLARRQALRATGSLPALLLPAEGLVGPAAAFGERLAGAWEGPVHRGGLPAKVEPVVLFVSADPPGRAWEQVQAIARQRSMKGRALAVLTLSGASAPGVAPRVVQAGSLAGLGVASRQPGDEAMLIDELLDWARALSTGEGGPPEGAGGPFTWLY